MRRRGPSLFYLAKKIVIVGDDKQISPMLLVALRCGASPDGGVPSRFPLQVVIRY